MVSVEAVKRYLSRKDFKSALNSALKIEDSFERLLALLRIFDEFPREEVLSEMLQALEGIEDKREKALAYSIVGGRAFYQLGRESAGGERYMILAVSLAREFSSPPGLEESFWRALPETLPSQTGIETLICSSGRPLRPSSLRGGLSSAVLSSLLSVARLIEKTADEINAPIALDYYRLAKEVYESLFFNLQAKELSEKIELIEEVLRRGKTVVDSLVEKGDVEKAVDLIRFLDLRERASEMLKLSYWLFLHERPDLGRRVFEDAMNLILVGKFRPSDEELFKIAKRMLRIGLVEEPLVLAGIIDDSHLASELLGEVAIAYRRMGELSKARSIAEGIPDESVKNRVLKALEGGEDVGHEQGLPLTGRGEERGAVPEDDRGSEVQGEVGQEEDNPAGEGDDS
ncbi:tetratricopeptide repeat protein [Thermococcus sp. JCM 11816]|uniref:tetratricopeptide repeat protein n=1 Tax=Thermococcus sp. (strain JCM 11816 / KS-1) TaxID=1295125 RepID=UPI003464F606